MAANSPLPNDTSTDAWALYELFQHIYVLLDDGDGRVLNGHGLSRTQFRLLLQLGNEGGQRLTTLSERLLLNKSTITRVVDQLEDAGLVQRAADPGDRRAQRVILTPEGKTQRQQAASDHLESLERRMETLTEAERIQLQNLLAKLRACLYLQLERDCESR
jgi:DNA-binding MarR family transcriptional regulator